MATWKKIITSGSAAELSSLTLDTALPVAQGGIGASSLTDKAVLISQDSGTDAIGAVALTSNGQIIIGGSDGPAAATITGTSNEVEISNGANSITIGLPDDVTIGQDLTVTRNISNASAVSDSHLTGSFSGSFSGDGSNLTGVGQDIDTLSNYGAQTLHQSQDHFLVSDNGTEKKINFSDLEDSIFANVSGDATIAGGGALTIASNAVENSMIAVGTIASASIAADAIDSNHLADDAVKTAAITDANVTLAKIENAAANTVIVRDANSSGVLSAKAVTNQQILIGDGTGFTAASLSGDVTMTNAGVVSVADNKIGNDELKQDDDITLQSLTTTNNVTIGGDLVVNGTTTTVATTNTKVEDKFMFLATGSAGTNTDAGIVVQSGSVDLSGSAFYHDVNVVTKTNPNGGRWSVAKSVGSTDTSVSPTQFVTTVKTDVVNPDATSGSYGAGEMHVNTSTGDIWIRFG